MISETAVRNYIRISETASCRLRISHRVRQTEGRSAIPYKVRASFAIGNALEPLVVTMLKEGGLIVDHARDYTTPIGEDPQIEMSIPILETADGTPCFWWKGHPDGLVRGISRDGLSPWLRSKLPVSVIEDLEHDIPVLLEIKTMNDSSYKDFVNNGLGANQFLAKYIYQIHGYMYGYRWLHQLPMQRTLVAAMNTYSRELETQHFNFDPATVEEALNYLIPVAEDALAGRIAEPDHDGSEPECTTCEFSHICPAAIRSRERSQERLQGLPTLVETAAERFDNLAAERMRLRKISEETATALTAIDAEIKELIGESPGIRSSSWAASFATVRGRKSLDKDAIADTYAHNGWELPYRQGAPTRRFSVKPLNPALADGTGEESDE
jgi:hypothetical protein